MSRVILLGKYVTRGAKNQFCFEAEIIKDWYIVVDLALFDNKGKHQTKLLDVDVVVICMSLSNVSVRPNDTEESEDTCLKYGFVWVCLGELVHEIVDIPEINDADRYMVAGGSKALNVFCLRTVENFLDMGHFLFFHTDLSGEEPHTEGPPFQIEITDNDEVLATQCEFPPPLASPTAEGGFIVECVNRVIRPYTEVLHKSNTTQADRIDSIYLFVQPVDEGNCVAYSLLCYLKECIYERTIRWFIQLIFAQDKPILENQFPKYLLLDPRIEMSIMADVSPITYWPLLRDYNVTYGAIPAAI